MKNLKEVIFIALSIQRENLLIATASYPVELYSLEEYAELMEGLVFSEEDILEECLNSLNLTAEDIDPNDFNDYQHETVSLCIQEFEKIIEAGLQNQKET